MAISTQYGINPDYFGVEDYKANKQAGFSDREILAFLDSNPGVLTPDNVKGKPGGAYELALKGVSSAPPLPFSTSAGGSPYLFGDADYLSAQRSGAKDADLLAFLDSNPGVLAGDNKPGSGGLYDRISQNLQSAQTQQQPTTQQPSQESYDSIFQSTLEDYKKQLESQTSDLQNQLLSAQKERDDAKFALDEKKKQEQAQKELEASQALTSLRTGSTTSGTPGAGLGSLSSGQSSYSIDTGGSRGGVLDAVYRNIDPTDSVLDKKVTQDATNQITSTNQTSRSEARQRALASGRSASDYYASRFG